jgi:FMN phosphatase YigB (HAD superfamily)
MDALIFDLGGVIVAHDNAKMLARIASRCRPPDAVAQIDAAFFGDPQWGVGAPIEALHAGLRRDFGYADDWKTFTDDFCCHFAVDASMLAYVRALAKRRRTLIFSNTNEVHWAYLVRATDGALAEIEHHLSHRIGLAKPQIESYRKVAELAGVAPERALFFDDLEANVIGARAAGWRAEVFRDEAELRQIMAREGIEA